MQPTEPRHTDRRGVEGFRILKAAEGGELPEEVRDGLDGLIHAVEPMLAEGSHGVVGMRFGRRVIVAPVSNPEAAVDVADVDLARKVILTVGGKDPGPSGSLLAQVLFLRTDAVVGYAEAGEVPGPTMDVMRQVLVPLRSGPAVQVGEVGTVALGKLASDVAGALGELDEDDEDQVNVNQA